MVAPDTCWLRETWGFWHEKYVILTGKNSVNYPDLCWLMVSSGVMRSDLLTFFMVMIIMQNDRWSKFKVNIKISGCYSSSFQESPIDNQTNCANLQH